MNRRELLKWFGVGALVAPVRENGLVVPEPRRLVEAATVAEADELKKVVGIGGVMPGEVVISYADPKGVEFQCRGWVKSLAVRGAWDEIDVRSLSKPLPVVLRGSMSSELSLEMIVTETTGQSPSTSFGGAL